MKSFVLDNSVTMRWFFDAGDHPRADAVLDELAHGKSEAVVPSSGFMLFYLVLSSDIASQRKKVDQFVDDLLALPIRPDQEGADRILTAVYRVAIDHKLTGYDAAYVELALRLGLPLVTFDEDILRAFATAGIATLGRPMLLEDRRS